MDQANLVSELSRYVEALSMEARVKDTSQADREESKTAPLFSWPVKLLLDHPQDKTASKGIHFEQYALMGTRLAGASSENSETDSAMTSDCSVTNRKITTDDDTTKDPVAECEDGSSSESRDHPGADADGASVKSSRSSNDPTDQPETLSPIFLNTNAPWSAFICGSQGSGKSYTLSCMLENCLLSSDNIGKNPRPLSGIVFHYDSHNSTGPCEAAYLGSHVPVTVLCSPSNYHAMQNKYAKLNTAHRVQVFPMFLKDQHLNTERMMRLMAFNGKEEGMPLYMEVMIRVLKEMAIESKGQPGFNFQLFLRRIKEESFGTAQKGPMNLRLELLQSFMASGSLGKKLPRSEGNIFDAWPGQLTVVDLTDPFVDAASACVLFDVCLSLFLENSGTCPKVIALDEAHKFMDQSPSSTVFTDQLISLIREQRHKGARVIIATQEPTISPKLLDLCSMTFVYRFTSPDWLATLAKHLAAVSRPGNGRKKHGLQKLFEEIVRLNTGECLLFSPSAILDVVNGKATKLGVENIKFRTRPRLTDDGGRSVMASAGASDSD